MLDGVRPASTTRTRSVDRAPTETRDAPASTTTPPAEVRSEATSDGAPSPRPTSTTAADARLRTRNDPSVAQLRGRLESGVADGEPATVNGPGRKKDPELPESAATGFTRVEGDAFRTDAEGNRIPPHYGDVDQGGLGDCWLMAASAAVAHRDPEYLTDRIARNEDGSFNVRLGDTTHRVEPTFPNAGYADPTPNNQSDTLWPALIEKAYAQQEGNSYASLEGGNPGRALEALTGHPTVRTSITESSDPDTLWNTVRAGIDGDHPMVVSTPDRDVATGFSRNHAYAVLDAYERDGERYVRIYNPWGSNDNSRSVESMTREVSLEELRANFTSLYVNGG